MAPTKSKFSKQWIALWVPQPGHLQPVNVKNRHFGNQDESSGSIIMYKTSTAATTNAAPASKIDFIFGFGKIYFKGLPSLSVKELTRIIMKSTRAQIPQPPQVSSIAIPLPVLPT